MEPLYALEGWFVSHLFYGVDRKAWNQATAAEQCQSRQRFKNLVEDCRSVKDKQIHCYAIWGLKADLGMLIIDPDLQHLVEVEADLLEAFPAGVLKPAFSFTSMSENSEYMSQDKDYDRILREQEGLDPESEEYKAKMKEFLQHMQVYINERLYPQIPPHRAMCFYPMNKARGEQDNWYLLDFETRKRYMSSHAATGRTYRGQVRQLVTGSVGLDDWEWGVTLFADDPYYFKKIVYEMRYDQASARFGKFGMFIVGIQLEPDALLQRLRLTADN